MFNFLSGKSGTQDVFFHIFNHLHQNGKQVILTSDKAPVDMQDIEQRLLSRFKWGLSAELQSPDYETRVSILKNKLYRDGVEMSDEIVDHVAKNIKTNIRELEGAIISLIAQASFTRKEVTLELAQQIVEKFVKNTKREVSIDYIQKVVSDYFEMDVATLQSKTRKRHIVQARQLAMFFAKKFTKASLASIGSQIGKRDHATVLHACKTVENLAETDKQFRKYKEDLDKKFLLTISLFMTKILMVCLGNICRSPLAEGILKAKVNTSKILVDSAGTGGYHVGSLPDSRSMDVALKHDIDISDQRCRKFTSEDFKTFDIIYVMDKSNYANVVALSATYADRKKVRLLLEEVDLGVSEVPDPYYDGANGFEYVYGLIEQACKQIAKKLENGRE